MDIAQRIDKAYNNHFNRHPEAPRYLYVGKYEQVELKQYCERYFDFVFQKQSLDMWLGMVIYKVDAPTHLMVF